MIWHSVVLVVLWAIVVGLWTWLRSCYDAFRRANSQTTPTQLAVSDDVETSPEEEASGGREFVVVEFNAWECAGLEILWAVVTTKIFDAVSKRCNRGCHLFYHPLERFIADSC